MLTSRPDGVRPKRTRTSRILAYTAAASSFALTVGLMAGTAAPAAPGGFSSPSASPSAMPSQRPAFTAAPTPKVSGTAKVGNSLTASPGTWVPAVAAFAYQWYRNGQPVAGATGSTYRLAAADNGAKVAVRVRANKTGYPVTERISAGLTVAAGTISATRALAISGTPRYGSTLKASGTWTAGSTVKYQWYRNSAAIKGATAPSLKLGTPEVGTKVSVRATVSQAGYTTRSDNSPAVTVGAAAFTSAPVPKVSGTARVGHKLTASAGTWSPSGAAIAYQWYRNSQAIRGATARTYTLAAADKGMAVKVRVRAARSGYTTIDRHSASVKIGAGTISATKSFKVSGTARYGSTVKVSQGWTPGVKVAYQWYRNGKAIKGATKSSFKLGAKDIGTKVSVRGIVTKSGYTTRTATSTAVKVGKALFTVKTAPKITGTKKAGAILRTSAGSFSAKPSSHSYQWYRNGKPISGAKKSSYRVAKADRGQKIAVRVTARKANYITKTAGSAAVRIAAR